MSAAAEADVARERRRTGRDEPPGALVPLRAGPLALALDGPDLRYLAHEGVELLRRVYMAVRDLDWDTIPGVVTARELDLRDDGFALRIEQEHHGGDLALACTLEATGESDGTIEYVVRGRALQAFEYAKVGLNIHHPIDGLAGRPWSGRSPWSGEIEGRMPERIHPQLHLVEEGLDLPIFPPVSELALAHEAGTMRFSFGGDLYEMEDQRNWSDQSYKTYSMPAFTGYRHRLAEGEEFVQRVRMRFEPSAATATARARRSGRRASPGPPTEAAAELVVGRPTGRRMPPLGLAHAGALPDHARDRLAALAPAHLRLDVDLSSDEWEGALADGLAACAATGATAELVLFLAGDPRPALDALAGTVAGSGVPVARTLVFRRDEETTPAGWVELARRALPFAAPIGGGTNMYYTELARRLPDLRPFDVVAYSLNPQVHAFDERSLAENVEGQAEQVRSARSLVGDRRLAITPVSLKPRFNAVAREAATAAPAGALPDNVDLRQPSLFGAAWTLGSLKHLAEAGADSITYYETVGPRGVIEGAQAAPSPFASREGMTFPLYHVLADGCALVGAELLACRSGEEPWLCGLAARDADGATTVLVANLTDARRDVRVAMPEAPSSSAPRRARVRLLDDESAPLAEDDAAAFRAGGELRELDGGALVLALGPYASAHVLVR